MADYLVRVMAKEAGVRGLACLSTDLVNEGARRHRTDATATVALGRGLTGAALLGALLKVRQRIALKFDGDGPIQKLIVESDAYGKVRGYIAHPVAGLPPLETGHGRAYNVQKAIGQGVLTVVRDLKLKELVESAVPLVTSEVDEDLEFYLNQSDQIPSAVQIGVVYDEAQERVTMSGGLLLQNLADAEGSAIHQLAERLQELPPIESMLASGQTPEQILAAVFGEVAYETLETRPLVFKCDCSRERSEQALLSLGREELEGLFEEGQAVVDCHFCHEQFLFSRDDLEMLLDELP